MPSQSGQKNAVSLVIAVYNSAAYLEFILTSLERQSMDAFEVIVADDGSGPEIGALIERMKSSVRYPIMHLWQDDSGFRKNVMLNKAIAAARTDYLIFIDGDCLPHREFLRDHSTHRAKDAILCGRRVNLSRQLTERISLDLIRSGAYDRLSFPMLVDGLLARSSNIEDGVRITNHLIRTLLHRNEARILGCNFSVEKSLLEKINGFNEDYRAPGIGEDTDIAFRLSLIGVRLIPLRYLAILYHLYHPPTPASADNKKIFERALQLRQARCLNGLAKHESAGR